MHLKPSPTHIEGSAHLRPFARALFHQAFDNADPAAERQGVITPPKWL
jgi:hypothetical protein